MTDMRTVPMSKDPKRVWVWLTPSEYVACNRVAREHGISINELGRSILIDFIQLMRED